MSQITPNEELIKNLRRQLTGYDQLMEDADPALMPSFSAFEQHQLEELGKNFKLTPATMAFRLENKRLGLNDTLKWYPSPFLMKISLQIALAIAKGNARILICAPPRHGKSRISTIHTPLWVLENFFGKHVVTTTYGAELSEDFARVIRDFIYQNPDDLNVRVRDDASKISKFLTNQDGALTSIGVGGPITGRGADILLIDDYIKQIKEALSATYRDYVFDWFTTTAMTRLEPNASVIIVATRWHHDDLIGRIIKKFGTTQEGGEWTLIKYHATARENDPLGRQVGEPLFPQRYPSKVLQERKKLLGTVYYDAIFDQEPHEGDSDITNKDWIIKVKAEELPKRSLRLVRVWDFAGTESKKADYTAGGLLGSDEIDTYLLNMIREQLTASKIEKLVRKVAESDGTNVDIVICQETGSAGKAVVEFYKNNILPEFRVHGAYWNTGKEIVAQPWLASCEDGHFKMLEANWNDDFLNEFGSFPAEGAGYHDDQMDVCSNGFIFLHGKRPVRVAWGRKTDTQKAQMNKALTAVDPQKAAQIAEAANQFSPHRTVLPGGKMLFGTLKGATFGRRKPVNN